MRARVLGRRLAAAARAAARPFAFAAGAGGLLWAAAQIDPALAVALVSAALLVAAARRRA